MITNSSHSYPEFKYFPRNSPMVQIITCFAHFCTEDKRFKRFNQKWTQFLHFRQTAHSRNFAIFLQVCMYVCMYVCTPPWWGTMTCWNEFKCSAVINQKPGRPSDPASPMIPVSQVAPRHITCEPGKNAKFAHKHSVLFTFRSTDKANQNKKTFQGFARDSNISQKVSMSIYYRVEKQ